MRRPLRVRVDDCRLMMDVEARNAIVAMVRHLVSAFKLPAHPRRPADLPGSAAAEQLPAGGGLPYRLPCVS